MNILVELIRLLYWLLVILIFARIILSWVNAGPYELRAWVFRLTEPILAPIRRLLPPMGGLDFSPFIVLLGAGVLQRFLIQLLI